MHINKIKKLKNKIKLNKEIKTYHTSYEKKKKKLKSQRLKKF